MAGGFEFSKNKSHSLPPEAAKRLVQAFDLLDYDFGVLAPHEKELLQKEQAGLPDNWVSAGSEPLSRIISLQGHKVGLLVFPLVDQRSTDARQDLYQSINEQGKRLRSQVHILIGISLWGSYLERQYFQGPPALFDVVLGSGQGPGFAGKHILEKKTLWVRPYTQGKSVHVIKVPEMPQKINSQSWESYEQIMPGLAKLSGKQPKDPQMDSILSQIR